MILTPWLVEPLYKQKKIRLLAITSIESNNIKSKVTHKMSTSEKDTTDSEEKISSAVKFTKKKSVNKSEHKKTVRENFNEEVSSKADYIQRELLWEQLSKVPPHIRNIAGKFLIYLILKQKDSLLIRPNGTIVVNNHEIPGSNISRILTNILSNKNKTADGGELAVLTLLKNLPRGLYKHISRKKRIWCLDYDNKKQQLATASKLTAIPVPNKDKYKLITGNPKDGTLLQPDLRPKMGPSVISSDKLLKQKHMKACVTPSKLKMNEKINDNVNKSEWYKCLDLSLN